jgi:dUTPase
MILARMENENIMMNLSTLSFVIKDVDRICQVLNAKNKNSERIRIDNPFASGRSIGGFGNTGKIQL